MEKKQEKQEEKIMEIVKTINENLLLCKDDWRFIVQIHTIIKAHLKRRKR